MRANNLAQKQGKALKQGLWWCPDFFNKNGKIALSGVSDTFLLVM